MSDIDLPKERQKILESRERPNWLEGVKAEWTMRYGVTVRIDECGDVEISSDREVILAYMESRDQFDALIKGLGGEA